MAEQPTSPSPSSPHGSLDGSGAGDHDEPYSGYHAYQFSTRQHARLLQLRGELLEARLGRGRYALDVGPIHPTTPRRRTRRASTSSARTASST